jgi:exodeoxyribonuclease V alpha subunit
MTREGYVEKIIYSNADNGYSVFTVSNDEGEEVFVGNAYGLGEGLYVIAEGDYVDHPQYNLQFRFTSCELKMPAEEVAIEKYLGSGIVKGLGEALARRIVNKFGTDSFRIIEEEPERLAEVKGITDKKARLIAVSYAEKKEFRDAVVFLSKYGVSANMAIRIYGEYGDRVYEVIRSNPYKLAEDVSGIGFKAADDIAANMGIKPDSEYRIRSAVTYMLNMATLDGHIYLPREVLVHKTAELIRGRSEVTDGGFGFAEYESTYSVQSAYEETAELINNQLLELAVENKIVLKVIDEMDVVYLASSYYIELNSARMLLDLKLSYDVPAEEIEKTIAEIEQTEGLTLDDIQKMAVSSSISAGVAVITGGPGTGKTTIINAIIKYFAKHGMEIRLCAPTGRAAKRMTESTGWPAQTIHRLLEFGGELSDTNSAGGLKFGRNRDNPLECDVVIVDEMSMVDSFIMNSLLLAISPGTRLIMVGDVNQLPSVGAGNVLKDIIASSCFPVTMLGKIFRQDEGSDIVYNAHKINRGEHMDITNRSKDFFFIPKQNAREIITEVSELISDNLPKYLHISPLDIQVLTPMRRYEVGVENMNVRLQALLNPPSQDKAEHERGDVIFREGDKVMQIKNNYRKEWTVYGGKTGTFVMDEGVGVFNGDMGIIKQVSEFDQSVTVHFDDGRDVEYGFNELYELEHAFAITVHKSQGSEYPAVILPILAGSRKLFNRNLLYTAITRARNMVVIVGNIGMVNQMVDNVEEQKRFTSLKLRLEEMAGE